MKDLIQYHYPCLEAINMFMQGIITRKDLVLKLREIEEHHQIENDDYNSDKGFWFNFFEGDTAATTINDIATIIALPKSHSNYQSLIESFEIAITDASLKVYYS
jgi:hypothetical protein